MAIVVSQTPHSFQPSGNKMIYQINSGLLFPNQLLHFEVEITIGGVLIQRLKAKPFPTTDGRTAILDISKVLSNFGRNEIKPFEIDFSIGNEYFNLHPEVITNYTVRIREIYSDVSGSIIEGGWYNDTTRSVIKGKIDDITFSKWNADDFFFNVLDIGTIPSNWKGIYLLTTFQEGAFKSTYNDSKEFIYLATNVRVSVLKVKVIATIDGEEVLFYKSYDADFETPGVYNKVIRYDVSPNKIFTPLQLEGLDIYEVRVVFDIPGTEIDGKLLTRGKRYKYKENNCLRESNKVQMWFLNRFGVYEGIQLYLPKGLITVEKTDMEINNLKLNEFNYQNTTYTGDNYTSEMIMNVSKYYLQTKSSLEYELNTNNLNLAEIKWLGQLLNSKICYQSILEKYYVPCQSIDGNFNLNKSMEGESIKQLKFKLNNGFNEDYIEIDDGMIPSLPIGFEVIGMVWSIG